MKKTKKNDEYGKINKTLIAKIIRENAFALKPYGTGHRRIPMKVSAEFVNEYIDRILIDIEVNIQHICQRVWNEEQRKTLLVLYKKDGDCVHDDIARHFGYKDSNTIIRRS